MSSIFETLNQQLGGDAVSQISRALGTDQGATARAVPAALASLMGGLSANASRSGGAEALAGALARDHDGSILDNLPSALAGGQGGTGEGILKHVFGTRRVAVEQGLSQKTGLDAGSTAQLLAMLAPLVLGALGKTQRNSNLNPRDLSDLLGGERRTIERQAPDGLGVLGSLLDRDGDGSVADDVAKMGAGLLGRFLRRR